MNKSYKIPGFDLDPAYTPEPHYNSELEFIFPASNRRPDILTPSTLPTTIQGYPLEEIKLANPIPKTTVFAWITLMLPVNLYVPGVKIRCKPSANF